MSNYKFDNSLVEMAKSMNINKSGHNDIKKYLNDKSTKPYIEYLKKFQTDNYENNKRKIIIISMDRKIKTKFIDNRFHYKAFVSIIGDVNLSNILCNHIRSDSFTESIEIYFSDTFNVKNKKASQILGFDIFGTAIIYCQSIDLELSNLKI